MTSIKKIFWILGNVLLGIGGFFGYVWGMFQAWGQQGSFFLYGMGSISVALVMFFILNIVIIPSDQKKKWGTAVVIFLGSIIVTVLIHGLLQNTILE
ncbi:hypothetical protein NC661_11375 [Aquibacillus koreensis]|uniref:Uncharacterized protein n=1 Tax=Aquibacillus koreensis TaxID=279446 RepID=A0A9X4AK09_9BACI|nr:hypothetical protein [Aquibacillus koreensis]MCT2537683.1 hypothetical protein [Aquibacillus koreensis]MDC3420970.1 hypothetical protein [Aquibacillus koreensis]